MPTSMPTKMIRRKMHMNMCEIGEKWTLPFRWQCRVKQANSRHFEADRPTRRGVCVSVRAPIHNSYSIFKILLLHRERVQITEMGLPPWAKSGLVNSGYGQVGFSAHVNGLP